MINAKPRILFDNRFNDGVPAATDTASGFDVLNIRDYRTYTSWKAASYGTKYITVNCGSAKTANALAIIGHNLKTANATVSVECSSDNFAADTAVALAGFTPTSDKAIMKVFTQVSKQYWRLKIVTASVAPQIAVCMIGNYLEFERFLTGPFDPTPEKIISESNRSKVGHLLGSVVRYKGRDIKASWKNLTPSWVANTFKPAWDEHISNLLPFFFAWDMENHADEVFYVSVPDNFALAMPYDAVRRSLTLSMSGVVE